MGLTGFQNARRRAAEQANIPAEGMSYDTAVEILAQPLLAPPPATEPPGELPGEVPGEVPIEPPIEPPSEPVPSSTPTRKTAKIKTGQAI